MKRNILLSLEKNAERIFVYEKNTIWTFRDLKNFIIKISHYFKSKNVKSVTISLPKSFYTYAIIVACYLSGVTYCVDNENNPKQRKEFCYMQIKPDLIISDANKNGCYNFINLENLLIAVNSYHEETEICVSDTEIAYISFTSGSTGTPKGCKIKTSALEKHITNDVQLFGFTYEDILGQYVPLHFDMSVLDVYASVMIGCALVVIDGGDKFRLGKKIKKHNITFLNIVPQVIDIMMKSGELTENTLSTVRMIRFGGDKVYKSKAKLLFSLKSDLTVVSTYGPTETTMFSTCCIIEKDNLDEFSTDILSIGKPIKGSKIELFDIENGVGEIVIYGDYVAEGYLGEDQGGYKEILIDDSIQKVYFTGDYAKKIRGTLYFEGRRDQQIKKDGNRISLVEIETAISKCIKNKCAVVFVENKIVCFIEKNKGENPDRGQIINNLQAFLPDYALPEKIHFIDEMKYNDNGKIDYRQLKLIR